MVPKLAKWAKELYVFQRTPSSVAHRGNKATDVKWFNKEVRGSGPGWQRRRAENFNDYISDAPTGEDLIADEWTSMRTFSVLVGKPERIQNIPEYIAKTQAIDLPRQERIRQRVADTLKNRSTAAKLMPRRPGWRKRPAFRDEYLLTFNRPNVYLVDTNGKGINRINKAGPVVAGTEYPIDVLIFGTGFYTPAGDSPAARSNSKIYGRGGKSLDDHWAEGVSTLHGIITPGFPNLFFPGPHQAGASENAVYTLDILSEHIVYLLREAEKSSKDGKAVTIEPDSEATDKWSTECLSRAGVYATLGGCTPGYLNAEGAADKPKSTDETMKAARAAVWGEGMRSYIDILNNWKADSKFQGIKFTPVL